MTVAVLALVSSNMHPSTIRMIRQIAKARGNSISFRFSSSQEAKNRSEALRRARTRGHVKFREANRTGRVLTVTRR